jgi:hypothetical protein
MRVNLFCNKRPMGVSPGETPECMTYGDQEGFNVLVPQFELPTDSVSFDRNTKRALTICNLFINHRLPVSQIAQLLEESVAEVVRVLVQHKIVRERREKPSTWPSDIERRRAIHRLRN